MKTFKFGESNIFLHRNDLPKSKFCYQNSMAIPLHNNLSLKDLKYVVKCIKNLDSKKNKI